MYMYMYIYIYNVHSIAYKWFSMFASEKVIMFIHHTVNITWNEWVHGDVPEYITDVPEYINVSSYYMA